MSSSLCGEEKMAGDGQEKIGLTVKGQDGEEVYYRVKRTSRLRKLMNEYADRKGLSAASIVFLFDGDKINADHTAKALEMKHGDTIDAMLHQDGGGAAGGGSMLLRLRA